ncbi:SCAN domain-containing protein 3-like [Crassostrea virginica]
MFPDSEIADKFACKRTKCTQILKQAIAPDLYDTLIKRCQSQPFTLLCDESNDRGADKCFAVLVRIFEEESRSVKTRFIDMPVVNVGTGANLYAALDKILRTRDIPWANVLAYSSDNCSTMKGKKNSVLSRVKEAQPHVMDIGCIICHLANLCCQAGVKTIPYPIDEMLVDIYYHFHNSSNRKELYTEFMEFTEVEPLKILKHASTRWLSLQKTVTRTLHHWPALSSYFSSHKLVETEGKVKKLAEMFKNPEVKMLMLQKLDFFMTT